VKEYQSIVGGLNWVSLRVVVRKIDAFLFEYHMVLMWHSLERESSSLFAINIALELKNKLDSVNEYRAA
jgi:hypothetical protein